MFCGHSWSSSWMVVDKGGGGANSSPPMIGANNMWFGLWMSMFVFFMIREIFWVAGVVEGKTCAITTVRCDSWPESASINHLRLSTVGGFVVNRLKMQPKTFSWRPTWFIYAYSHHESQHWAKSQWMAIMERFSSSAWWSGRKHVCLMNLQLQRITIRCMKS